MPINPLASAYFVISPHLGLPIIQDMTKPFFIKKLVIATDNTIVQIYSKDTILIDGIPFLSLDKAWPYILDIPNNLQ